MKSNYYTHHGVIDAKKIIALVHAAASVYAEEGNSMRVARVMVVAQDMLADISGKAADYGEIAVTVIKWVRHRAARIVKRSSDRDTVVFERDGRVNNSEMVSKALADDWASISDLSQATGLSDTTVRKYVNRLVDAKHAIQEYRSRESAPGAYGRTTLFRVAVYKLTLAGIALTTRRKEDFIKAILNAIPEEFVTVPEIAEASGLPPWVIRKYVFVLSSVGLVVKSYAAKYENGQQVSAHRSVYRLPRALKPDVSA